MAHERDYNSIRSPREGSREARMTRLVDDLWRAFGEPARAGGYSWVGFYTKSDDREEMVLGPRRDKPACSPIGLHGMCGFAWRERRAVVVRDVRRLGEHYVACDPRDASEVVVPMLEADGRCWGVLDVDSFEVGAFTTEDARGLAEAAERAGLTAPLGGRAWPVVAGF